MRTMKSMSGTAGLLTVIIFATGVLGACDVVPGSKAWCDKLEKQDKTTWSIEDAKTFAEECVVEPTKDGLEDMKDGLSQ